MEAYLPTVLIFLINIRFKFSVEKAVIVFGHPKLE